MADVDTTQLTAATTFVPAATYLLVLCALIAAVRRVPVWLHPILLVAGISVRFVQSGWQQVAIELGCAAVIFVLMVLLAARTVSGVTLLATVTTTALTPFDGWPWLLAGLLVAAVVATVRTWRSLGKGRVVWLAMDTMSAVGVSPAGHLKRPEINLVPARADLTDVHDGSANAARMKMYLPPYLLLGVVLAATVAYFVA